jgi:hypothetical protein
MVSREQLDALIKKSFGTPSQSSSKEKTMLHAIEVGKITAGYARPKLSGLREELQEIIGRKVDVSIILKGGEFDAGANMKF